MQLRDPGDNVCVVTGASSARALGGEGFRVSLLEPGAAYTNWGASVSHDAMKQERGRLQLSPPEDVANALVYAFAQPGNVNAQEIGLVPTRQVSF